MSIADSSTLVFQIPDTLFNETWEGFAALYLDTVAVVHSAYGSFADVIDALPIVFHLNHGSVGQLALAYLFSAPSNETLVQYGDLVLADPLTGLSDLNMVPVEQIAEVQLPTQPGERFWRYQTLGQTLRVIPHDISDFPARSRFTYRTGQHNYDDLDVMLGMRLSPKTDLNLGGLMKNYGVVTSQGEYKAQKIRGRLLRKIDERMEIRYSFLFNRFDLNEYVPCDKSSTTKPFRPHQKDLRYDHALTFEKKNFKVSLQHTRLYREFYDYHADIDELYKPDALRLTAELLRPIASFRVVAGGQGFANFIRSKNNDDFTLIQGREWMGVGYPIRPDIDFELLLNSTQRSGFAPSLYPSITLSFHPNEILRFQLLTSQNIEYPGPMELGYPAPVLAESWAQRAMKSTSTTLLAEYDTPKLTVFSSASYRRIKDRLVVSQSEEGMGFFNHPLENRLGLSGIVRYRPKEWIGLWLKGMYNIADSKDENYHLLNLPQSYVASHLELSGRFFKDDLFATLRVGANYCGPRWSFPVWTGEYGGEHIRLDGVVVPYARAIFVIDNVTIFVSMQNLLVAEYEIVYGYPMPGREFRWGLSWSLVD